MRNIFRSVGGKIIVCVIFLLISVILIRSLFLRPEIWPQGPLPLFEIVFYDDRPEYSDHYQLGFIHPDGTGLTIRDVKLVSDFLYEGDPFKAFNEFIDTQVSWSPDGKYLVLKNSTKWRSFGVPFLISAEGHFLYCQQDFVPHSNSNFSIIRDTTVLITVNEADGGYKVILYDMANCKVIQTLLTTPTNKYVGDVSLSSQGWLTMVRGDNSRSPLFLEIHSQAGDVVAKIDYGSSPVWSRDGEWLAFVRRVGSQDMLAIFSKKDLSIREITQAHASPSWSPDGTWIVFERSGEIYKVNLITGEETFLTRGVSPSWR